MNSKVCIAVVSTIFIALGQRSGPPTPNATNSFWLHDGQFQSTRTGDLPSTVDIAVIGAGYDMHCTQNKMN